MLNNELFIEMIGFVAAFCTTFAFLPQVLQLYRTRVTKGISLSMYLIFSTGVFLWLIYGLILYLPSLIIANLLTFMLALVVLFMKLKWD